MELQITGQNIDLPPAVHRYIERKLNKLNRHLPNILTSRVEIIEEKTKSPEQHYVVQMLLDSSGTLLIMGSFTTKHGFAPILIAAST